MESKLMDGKININDMQSRIEAIDSLVSRLDVASLSISEGDIHLKSGNIYRGAFEGNIAFSLPQNLDNSVLNQILVQAKILNDCSVDFGTPKHFGDAVSSLTVGSYNIVFEHNGTDWVYGVLKIGG